jgi:DNA gyrase subunit A
MQRSYLDYSMSVIVSRALPDVRDGLKPVHRRVLYAMYDGGYRPDRNFSKSARVVGDVMGNYHPHGDSAIYDALVRLAQPWSLRYPLVQGQGNFGSPGNDPAAAQRYTECRMAPLAMEMVRDIDEETVDFGPNYDGRTQEPLVLPSRFPNLLVNGSSGIAVGMATNIPPHNLREVAAGAQWMLENPEAEREERLAALMELIKGPDFPTGALIVGRKGIEDAQRTGRGSVTMRAVVTVEEDSRGRQLLVVTELPYQVNPDNLLLRIAELVGEGKLTGIADVRDDSSSRTGMRLIIELKRDAIPKVVINNLYKHTALESSFSISMLAIDRGRPKLLSLKEAIACFIEHRREVILRRTRFLLREAEGRAEKLEGYLIALANLDQFIKIIRDSQNRDEARTRLLALTFSKKEIEKFGILLRHESRLTEKGEYSFSELQTDAILELRLYQLTGLERDKLNAEYQELLKTIKDLLDILAREDRVLSIIKNELNAIKEKHAGARLTELIPEEGEISIEDLIANEGFFYMCGQAGQLERDVRGALTEAIRDGKSEDEARRSSKNSMRLADTASSSTRLIGNVRNDKDQETQ